MSAPDSIATAAITRPVLDLTPTWQDILPAILAVILNPKAPHESRNTMFEELGRMAQAADAYVHCKKLHDELTETAK